MGKIIETLRKRDAGAMGVGAMIVFIAMVLVAGIAAAVLIQTANRLEIQAMNTGEITKKEVATGVHIIDVEGHRNGTTGDIDWMTICISSRAGSGDVDLANSYIEISNTVRKHVLRYDSTEFHSREEINGNIMQVGFFDGLSGQEFGLLVLSDADHSCNSSTPVINSGDKVMILINTSIGRTFNANIGERSDIWGMVQPEEGSAGVFSFRTPAAYTDGVFKLY